MKVVKVCPDCLKYNNYKLSECKFCGANLPLETIEVDDNENEAKKVIGTEINQIANDNKITEENKKSLTCPICGSEASGEWCNNCGYYLVGINSVVQEKQEIEFKLSYKGLAFAFKADSEVKTLGRNDFDKANDPNFISISRKHLQYYVKEGNLYIKDISSYGTSLNGTSLEKEKEYKVSSHDKIKFVYYEMEIVF